MRDTFTQEAIRRTRECVSGAGRAYEEIDMTSRVWNGYIRSSAFASDGKSG